MTDSIELVGGPADGERRPRYEYEGQTRIVRKSSSGTAVYRRRAGDVTRYDFNGYEQKP